MKKLFTSDYWILPAIVINTIAIVLLSFPQWSQNIYLISIDTILTIFFIIELLFKLRLFGFKYYKQNALNMLDFGVIVLGSFSLLESFTAIPFISAITLLRIGRLFRLVRLFQFVPHFNQLLKGIGRAMKASVLVLIVLVLFALVLAVIATQSFGARNPELFGNPIVSLFTIFQLFTIEGWTEISDQVTQGMPGWQFWMSRLFFVFVVLSGGIFGLSLANAVFVDEMTIDNNQDLEKKVDALTEEVKKLMAHVNDSTDLNQP